MFLGDDNVKDLNSLSAALRMAGAGELEAWVHGYLLSAGRNPAFSEGLRREKRYYLGPMEMELEGLERCCGPEPEMEYRVDAAGFEAHVAELQRAVLAGAGLPPLIANYHAGEFVLNDGNHRLEALRRLGIRRGWVVVWVSSEQDRQAFLSQYRGRPRPGREENGLSV